MEAGFFSEEKCSTFYNQVADLDSVDGSIFDRLVLNNGKQFDPLTTFWDQIDDDPGTGIFTGGTSNGENNTKGSKKEDFPKMLHEWQEHLFSSMQVLDNEKMRPEIPDMFSVLPNSQPVVSIDELFPMECSALIKEEVVDDENEGSVQIKTEDFFEEMQLDNKTEVDTSNDITIEDFIKIETKIEFEDECVDVETVREKIPVLEAGDMTTLLEQFEASEAVNTSCKEADEQLNMSHQNIKDALPKEVIDRIKASTRKKSISLIPPMPSKKTVRSVTHVTDASSTLGHKKLLKLVSNNGKSVQFDHDYCSGTGSENLVQPPNNFYQTDVADYTSSMYSRLPDYYVALAPQKTLEPPVKSNKDWGEKNSKKDSGLESGDVSDASEEVPAPTKTISMVSVLKRNNLPQNSASTAAVRTDTPSNISNKNNNIVDNNSSNSSSCSSTTATEALPCIVANLEPVRKKKLNLEEYRSRREERERIRSEEGSRTSSPNFSELQRNNSSCSVSKDTEEQPQKVTMHSVEVQATPEEIESHKDASRSKTRSSKNSQEPSRRRREYRKRRVSSSSSSSSLGSRRSKNRSSQKIRKNSNSSSSRTGGAPSSRTRSIWSRSRSPSSSSVSSCSTCSSRSRSRSRSPVYSDSRRSNSSKRSNRPSWRTKHRFNKSFSRRDSWCHQRTSLWVSGSSSRSSSIRDNQNSSGEWSEKERIRQVEERRVIYVGRIEEGTTKAHLRERFSVFGPIIDISVHFREHGDNYGFVTFAYKVDAYEAVEHGNDDPLLPRYDLSFGGRRAFCKQRYADLDGERNNLAYRSLLPSHRSDASFDALLREAQAKLNKRSSV